MLHKLLQENELCHYIGCSLEAFLPSHLQKTQECRAIDGLSPTLASACGHMRPPSKGWVEDPQVQRHAINHPIAKVECKARLGWSDSGGSCSSSGNRPRTDL